MADGIYSSTLYTTISAQANSETGDRCTQSIARQIIPNKSKAFKMNPCVNPISMSTAPTLLNMPGEVRENIWYHFLLSCYKDDIYMEDRNHYLPTPHTNTMAFEMRLETIAVLDDSPYSERRKEEPLAALFCASQQIAAEVKHVLLTRFRFLLNMYNLRKSEQLCTMLDKMSLKDQNTVHKIQLITDIEPVKIAWTDHCAYVKAQLPELKSVILVVVIDDPFLSPTNLLTRIMKIAVRFKTVEQLIVRFVRLINNNFMRLDDKGGPLFSLQKEVTARIALGDWEAFEQSNAYTHWKPYPSPR